jgi:membrane protein DedA with SNARE-associated domain
MGWWRFLAYNATGAALWVSAWGLGVYYFGPTLAHVVARLHGLGYVIGLAGLALIIVWIILYSRHRRAPMSGGVRG